VNVKHEIVVKKLSLTFQSKHCQTESDERRFNHVTQSQQSTPATNL
jgi:hypothetical protein